MNDPQEFIRGRKIIDNILAKYEEEHEIKTKNRISTALKEAFRSDSQFMSSRKIYEDILTNSLKTPFVLSFSAKKDDLPMWIKYGNNGKGICLGFEEKIPKFERIDNITSTCPIAVEYSDRIEGNRPLQELLNTLFKECFLSIKKEEMGSSIATRLYCLGRLHTVLCPFFKNEKYKDEAEYRIVGGINSLDCVEFRVKNGCIIPYVELPLSLNFLREIIIGPCCDDKAIKRNIEFILLKKNNSTNLEMNKTPIKISNSCIPYRII